MFRLDSPRPVRLCDRLPRRDFLHAGAVGLLGLTLGDLFALRAEGALAADRDVNCIALMLVGAPGHLDTWDPKPDAPREIRGPYRAIPTNVAGVRISEIFPRMANLADKYALLRSVHYEGLAVHDVGHQVLQTGRLFEPDFQHPHVGSVLAYAKGSRGDLPAHVVLPHPIGHTGGNMPHGQTAGFLGPRFDPFVVDADPVCPDFAAAACRAVSTVPAIRADGRRTLRGLVDDAVRAFEDTADARRLGSPAHDAYTVISSSKARAAFDLTGEPESVKDRYGRTRFGMSCLVARRLIEAGVRFVTVNMFDTVFNDVTWDSHGSAPFSTLDAYGSLLGPMFDDAYSSLIEDLDSRGLLATTLVAALGEFGRTPKMNAAGGRDHWPQCWTVSLAGGGIRGGQAVGASDAIGAYPVDRPIPAASIAATMLHALGLRADATLPGPANRPMRIVEAGIEPVHELF